MNKKLIAILTLVMFAMTLLPMGAFAATTNTALQIKSIGTTATETAGNLRITETSSTVGSIINGDTITITLKNGAKFATPAAIVPGDFTVDTAEITAVAVTSANSNSVTVTVTRAVVPAAQAWFTMNFATSANLKIDATSMTSDQVAVDIYSPNGGVTNGEVVIANTTSGATDATVLSKTSITAGKTGAAAGIIRIVENRAGALSAGDVIRLSIPTADVDFGAAATATLTNAGGTMTIDTNLAAASPSGAGVAETTTAPAVNADGYSEITFEVITASTTSPAVIEVTGITLDVDEDAALGDVQVKVAGDATSQTLVLSTIKGYGYSLTAPETIAVMAGDDTETLKDFWLKENAAATIVGNGRTIKLELPVNTAWVAAPTMTVNKGVGLTFAAPTISADRRTVTYANTAGDFSTSAYEYKFEDGKIAVKATASEGDVVVTFGGSSNVTGELKVAEIKKPVTVTSQDVDVVVGKQAQPIGDILIKEVKAGYIKAAAANNTIVIDLGSTPAATFAATPKVEVVEGDLKIDKLTKTASTLTITIDRVSTVPSTIKVSGITVDLNRTPAEGAYNMRVYGTALNRVHATGIAAVTAAAALDTAATNAVVQFKGMTVVTPAPDQEGVVKEVQMTVGSTVYSIAGVEMTMDVAPYIKGGRTYFPVRYVANALNITDDNVVWDGAQRTVTIFKGNRIVQVTIGSNTMLVNGVPLTMDAAPEITAERTMLPIRFVAQGLGVNVNYDAATQTVTLN